MILGAIDRRTPGRRKGALLAQRSSRWDWRRALFSPPARRDFAAGPPPAPYGGVACSIGQPFWVPLKATAETLPWPSVFLGHFSGGRPFLGADGETLIDWRDEYVCFPSSGQCRAWVRESYRTHHRPEGYRACLLLR